MTEEDTFNKLKRKDVESMYREWMECDLMDWESTEVTKWFRDRFWDKEEWYNDWEESLPK